MMMHTQSRLPEGGLLKSARLLKALGARASDVWAELPPGDASRLSDAMEQLVEDEASTHAAAEAFLNAEHSPQASRAVGPSVWSQLSRMGVSELCGQLAAEHPQMLAVIITRLAPQQAAALVRRLPPEVSVETLRRVLNLGAIQDAALGAIEADLEERVGEGRGPAGVEGERMVARIFDELDTPAERAFLAALDHAAPGTASRVRSLMFTFADLAKLGPAGLQTLLSEADRHILVLALKGDAGPVGKALFGNMTSRAGDVLREEMEALGPLAKADVEKARRDLVGLARDLLERGEIQLTAPIEKDDLVE